ncbi:replication initiator protein A [uncultured Streptococcus sp.]|uniref:replication initiator protein A n=1 Tax=uncultured Streptococcus sp. TaxID=83427 RepID=UPI0025E8481D|nr:replication initiator protein A [uncultured Streptococcus sp.]
MTENDKKKIANSESFIDETFTKLPNFLVNNSEYAGISNDAKILYLLMRNAFEGSVKNGLKDEKGIYFYFTESKMSAQLHKSRYTCREYKKELREAHLIEYDNDDYDPNTGKRLPTKFYMRKIEYSIGDTLSHGKKLTTAKGKNENAENSDNSVNPKTNENSQAPQAYGDHHGKKLAMDENDDENARSLDATAPLEENENSQAPQAYGDHHGKKLAMVENDDVDGKTTDKSTISKNENFNNVPSAQQNQPWSKIDHNKDNKIDTTYNSSMLHNKRNESTTSIPLNEDNEVYEDFNKKAQHIANTVYAGLNPKYNKLNLSDLEPLATWLQDIKKVKQYTKRINNAIYQAYEASSTAQQAFYNQNEQRILHEVNGLLCWCIDRIENPEPKQKPIDKPDGYIFTSIKQRVIDILKNPKMLDESSEHSNKRVDKGTDWSKKKAPEPSGYSTEKLKDLFKDLKNK